jgi:hypothetical protein
VRLVDVHGVVAVLPPADRFPVDAHSFTKGVLRDPLAAPETADTVADLLARALDPWLDGFGGWHRTTLVCA